MLITLYKSLQENTYFRHIMTDETSNFSCSKYNQLLVVKMFKNIIKKLELLDQIKFHLILKNMINTSL